MNAQASKKGKSAALNDTVLRVAKGEIVVFTDATAFLEKDAIKKLIRNFADRRVGAICGKKGGQYHILDKKLLLTYESKNKIKREIIFLGWFD